MDKTSFRVLTLTVSCMLLLSATAERAVAWPCPPPAPPCHTCTPTGWEPYGDCWGGCPSCESCVSCWCVNDCIGCESCIGGSCQEDDSKCGAGETCCGHWCCGNVCCDGTCCFSWQMCCNGTCCDPGDCCNSEICCSGQECCTDSGSYCCPSGYTCCEGNCCFPLTETCCNGECCSTDDCCIDGNCVSTCWTTNTQPGSTDPCPPCDGITGSPHCSGTQREESDYLYCTSAGTGTGGYCACYETLQVVGYYYECKINWDCGHIIDCADGIIECIITCATAGCMLNVAQCIACILENSEECTDPCEFVESCEKDPDNYNEIKREVFSNFGGSSCEG